MKNYLKNSFIQIKPENFLIVLIFFVPLLNFIPGFTFDLYTPSMPSMAVYFHCSVAMIKNTVTATLIGFAFGAFISGIFIDALSARSVILIGLFFYTITSILSLFCHSAEELIVVRFIQGVLSGAFTIGCRTIIVDSLKDHDFNVATLYTSLSFGMGAIIGPFIGGILQHHFGWKANFIAYAVMGFIFLLLFFLFVNNGRNHKDVFSAKRLLKSYSDLLTHKTIISSIFLASLCRIQLILYSTIGVFLVQNILHKSAFFYGNTALLIGLSYFLGTLCNRFLIKKWRVDHLIQIGLMLAFISSIVQIALAIFGQLNVFNLIMPITIVSFGAGFINSNLSIKCLKIFPQHASIAASILVSLGLTAASIELYFINTFDVDDLVRLSIIFAAILIAQLIIFYGFFNKIRQEALQ